MSKSSFFTGRPLHPPCICTPYTYIEYLFVSPPVCYTLDAPSAQELISLDLLAV